MKLSQGTEDQLLMRCRTEPNNPAVWQALTERAERQEIERRAGIARARAQRKSGSVGFQIAALERQIAELETRRKASNSAANIKRFDAVLKAHREELRRLTETKIQTLRG